MKPEQPRTGGSVQPLIDDASNVSGFSFSFQPIVDLKKAEVVAHEALVRGAAGEPPSELFEAVDPSVMLRFDEACRRRALEMAGRLGLAGSLHLNCSGLTPDRLLSTLEATRSAAESAGVDPCRVVLEFDRLEPLGSPDDLHKVRAAANHCGLDVLADNFGASEIGMKRLVVFQPQWLKIDRNLVARIHESERQQNLVSGLLSTCRMLGINVIAGGVERSEELDWLKQAGVCYAQGFLLGRPVYEAVPHFDPERVAT